MRRKYQVSGIVQIEVWAESGDQAFALAEARQERLMGRNASLILSVERDTVTDSKTGEYIPEGE